MQWRVSYGNIVTAQLDAVTVDADSPWDALIAFRDCCPEDAVFRTIVSIDECGS